MLRQTNRTVGEHQEAADSQARGRIAKGCCRYRVSRQRGAFGSGKCWTVTTWQDAGLQSETKNAAVPCKNVVQDRARTCKYLARRGRFFIQTSCKKYILQENTVSCFKLQEGILQEKYSNARFYVHTSCKKEILQGYSKLVVYDVLAVINLARRKLIKHVYCYR